jgi:hypothetical protein
MLEKVLESFPSLNALESPRTELALTFSYQQVTRCYERQSESLVQQSPEVPH